MPVRSSPDEGAQIPPPFLCGPRDIMLEAPHLELTMPRRRPHPAQSLALKSAELSLAAPQVIAHRIGRMAMAGPVLSERDRREFQLMGTEKVTAFTQSWNAMVWQTIQAQQAMALSLASSMWNPWTAGPSLSGALGQWQNATIGVLSKGLAPVHRKATANARRLNANWWRV